MAISYISLGSNIEPELHLDAAVQVLKKFGSIKKISPRYRTEPLGHTTQAWYVNQVVELETELAPEALLHRLQELEIELDRKPRRRWEPREIDLDILLYNSLVLDSVSLHIPHLGLPQRRFVLVPLHDIAPELIDPRSKKTIQQLLMECVDKLRVEII